MSSSNNLLDEFLQSDIFYNAGWTEDLRRVVNYLHQERPMAPLFAVGTSIGANVLVLNVASYLFGGIDSHFLAFQYTILN